jgi:hypothetical protein
MSQISAGHIPAFTRGELNKMISEHIGMRVIVNDEQWQQVADSILADDESWSAIDRAVDYAVIQLINPIVDALNQKETK